MKIDNDNTLPPEKAELLGKFVEAKEATKKIVTFLEAEYDKINEVKEEFEKAYAIASTKVFPKVKISFGRQFVSVSDYLGPSLYKMLGSDIIRIEP